MRGLGIRSSLLYCFKEERRQEVGDLREVFPIGSYVCSDCSNIVEEYPKLRERCQYVAFQDINEFSHIGNVPDSFLSARYAMA